MYMPHRERRERSIVGWESVHHDDVYGEILFFRSGVLIIALFVFCPANIIIYEIILHQGRYDTIVLLFDSIALYSNKQSV